MRTEGKGALLRDAWAAARCVSFSFLAVALSAAAPASAAGLAFAAGVSSPCLRANWTEAASATEECPRAAASISRKAADAGCVFSASGSVFAAGAAAAATAAEAAAAAGAAAAAAFSSFMFAKMLSMISGSPKRGSKGLFLWLFLMLLFLGCWLPPLLFLLPPFPPPPPGAAREKRGSARGGRPGGVPPGSSSAAALGAARCARELRPMFFSFWSGKKELRSSFLSTVSFWKLRSTVRSARRNLGVKTSKEPFRFFS